MKAVGSNWWLGPLGGLVPGMAEGGIVTSPTLAMIGEGGQSEAVIPLDKLGKMGGGNITVNVTGGLATSADIGRAVVNAIKAMNRVDGPAQIQVA
jgi:SLT domain-containing protein